MQDIQALAQQNKLKNIIADYISALQEEIERLKRIQNPPGIIDSLNSTRMSIFDKENFNNIDNHLDQLGIAITTLNGLLNNPNLNEKNFNVAMNDINQNQPHAMETINAIGRTKRNQIAVTTLGAAVVGLSIAITVLTFGAAAPAMIGLNAAIFTVGVGATAWGAKAIHDRKKSLLELKIAKEITPTKSEIILYPKMIREILLNEKGDKEFTPFQEQLYRQVDTEYDLRKKIEAGTELTPNEIRFHKSMIRNILEEKNESEFTQFEKDLYRKVNKIYDLKMKINEGKLTRAEKFFHRRKIRRILQEKINNGEELSGYAQELYNELFSSNSENETGTGDGFEMNTEEVSEASFNNPLYEDQNKDDPFDEHPDTDEPSEFDESSTATKPLQILAENKEKKNTPVANPVDFDHSDSDYSEL